MGDMCVVKTRACCGRVQGPKLDAADAVAGCTALQAQQDSTHDKSVPIGHRQLHPVIALPLIRAVEWEKLTPLTLNSLDACGMHAAAA